MDSVILFSLSLPGFNCAHFLGNLQHICVSKFVSAVYYTRIFFYIWLHYTQSISRGGSQRSVRRCTSFTVSRGPHILVQCVAVYLKKVLEIFLFPHTQHRLQKHCSLHVEIKRADGKYQATVVI